MTWNPQAINDIIDQTTTVYRKGAVVTEREVGSLHVTEVMAYPPVADAPIEPIDVHFFAVVVDKDKALELSGDLAELLASYPHPDRLKGGPSYIGLGAELGSQEHALRLLALGKALDMWEIITPALLGVTGEAADRLAGGGFVMCSGWSPEDAQVAL